MKYKTVNEILDLVMKFENGTISRTDWKHAEHLTVGFYYLSNHDYDTALTKMRTGIFNLLNSFGVDLTKEMPYHETMTVFWMRSIDEFSRSNEFDSVPVKLNALIEKCDKDYPFNFYSQELLFSDEARAKFVEPDLQKL